MQIMHNQHHLELNLKNKSHHYNQHKIPVTGNPGLISGKLIK